jgi:hypothetical protein
MLEPETIIHEVLIISRTDDETLNKLIGFSLFTNTLTDYCHFISKLTYTKEAAILNEGLVSQGKAYRLDFKKNIIKFVNSNQSIMELLKKPSGDPRVCAYNWLEILMRYFVKCLGITKPIDNHIVLMISSCMRIPPHEFIDNK